MITDWIYREFYWNTSTNNNDDLPGFNFKLQINSYGDLFCLKVAFTNRDHDQES